MKLLRAQDRGNGRKDLGPLPPPSVDVARKVQERRHHTSMAEADDVDRSCRRQAHDLKMELWVELLRTRQMEKDLTSDPGFDWRNFIESRSEHIRELICAFFNL